MKTASDKQEVRPWWRQRRIELLALCKHHEATFVYDRATIASAARAVLRISSLSRLHYALKANPHGEIIRLLHDMGLAMECVSRGEVERVLEVLPTLNPGEVMFTPNFASRDEYAWALGRGIRPTIDNLYLLQAWGELFRGQDIIVRVDTGVGRGHHEHVQTGGEHSKFGIALDDLQELYALTRRLAVRVSGLHAHTGSGIFEIANWISTATTLAELSKAFPDVGVIDIGGGLAVPDREDVAPIDLARLAAGLAPIMSANPNLELWMEPGRYLVASAGVLLARVTQLKTKGNVRYLGIATGMNSLIRPALYGAYHEIVNLSRLDEVSVELVHVVGPICEGADFLGRDRLLPHTREGDVLLIANAGAYCHAMSSNYNLRDPAVEILL